MKRFLAVLCGVALLLLPRSAMAEKSLISAQTTTGESSSIPIGSADTINVQVWDTVGSGTSTTVIQEKNASGDWFTVATITDPDTTGELWGIPRADFMRVNVTACSSCSVSATVSAWRADKSVI